MPIVITAVRPQPRIDLRSADGETGAPIRVTTYRGIVGLELARSGQFALEELPEVTPIAFFLPDSLPYPPGTEGTVSISVSPNLHPIIDRAQVGGPGPIGVENPEASLQDDPRGAAVRWVHVGFLNRFTSKLVAGIVRPQIASAYRIEVTYEVTVAIPVEARADASSAFSEKGRRENGGRSQT